MNDEILAMTDRSTQLASECDLAARRFAAALRRQGAQSPDAQEAYAAYSERLEECRSHTRSLHEKVGARLKEQEQGAQA